jgi:hypothetical protein
MRMKPKVLLALALACLPALARLEGPWAPAGPLPRAVIEMLDDPQWAELKKVPVAPCACSFINSRDR